eukprot:gene5539-7657_t
MKISSYPRFRSPVPLAECTHREIFDVIKACFSYRLPDFDELVATKLWQALLESNNVVINEEAAKSVVGNYYDIASFRTNEQRLVLWIIKLIFKSAYVLVISHYDCNRQLVWPNIDRFVQEYGHLDDFKGLDSRELNFLLNYRNVMKIAQLIVPAKNNKGSLLLIAGSLEGSRNEYVTGGGQKPEVTRRVVIYEREGGIIARQRPSKSGDEVKDHESSKPKSSSSDSASARSDSKLMKSSSESSIIPQNTSLTNPVPDGNSFNNSVLPGMDGVELRYSDLKNMNILKSTSKNFSIGSKSINYLTSNNDFLMSSKNSIGRTQSKGMLPMSIAQNSNYPSDFLYGMPPGNQSFPLNNDTMLNNINVSDQKRSFGSFDQFHVNDNSNNKNNGSLNKKCKGYMANSQMILPDQSIHPNYSTLGGNNRSFDLHEQEKGVSLDVLASVALASKTAT